MYLYLWIIAVITFILHQCIFNHFCHLTLLGHLHSRYMPITSILSPQNRMKFVGCLHKIKKFLWIPQTVIQTRQCIIIKNIYQCRWRSTAIVREVDASRTTASVLNLVDYATSNADAWTASIFNNKTCLIKDG